jgi:hypothetical protein
MVLVFVGFWKDRKDTWTWSFLVFGRTGNTPIRRLDISFEQRMERGIEGQRHCSKEGFL